MKSNNNKITINANKSLNKLPIKCLDLRVKMWLMIIQNVYEGMESKWITCQNDDTIISNMWEFVCGFGEQKRSEELKRKS